MPSKNAITEALKQRIIDDDQHGFFDEDRWLDTTFGLFYDNDEEFIDKAVFEVTEHLVRAEGFTLPDNAASQLEGDVNADNTPGEAIDPMFIAAGKAVALNNAPKPAASARKGKAAGGAGKSKTAGGAGKSSGSGKTGSSGGSGKASGGTGGK